MQDEFRRRREFRGAEESCGKLYMNSPPSFGKSERLSECLANVLKSKNNLAPGTKAKRFYGIPAIFWNYSHNGEPLFLELKEALVHLEWQPYAAAQQNRPTTPKPIPDEVSLLFLLTDQGLYVKDNNLNPILFYSRSEMEGSSESDDIQAQPSDKDEGTLGSSGIIMAAPQASAPADSSSTGILNGFSNTLFGSGATATDGTNVTAQTHRGGLIVNETETDNNIWYGPRMSGKPIGIEVGDFNGDNRQEVAIAFSDRLVIAHISQGKLQLITTYDFDTTITPLTIDGMDLNHDGKAEIYLSAARDLSANSSVFELQNNQLTETIKNIPWFLRKVPLPDEGETLLGQAIDPKAVMDTSDYRGSVFRISREGGSLIKNAELPLPAFVELNGFLPIKYSNRSLVVNIDINDKLQLIENKGNLIWESSDQYGGSAAFFKRMDPIRSDTRYRYLKQRIETGPENTVLVPQNKGSRITSLWRQFNQSHLEALTFNGYAMTEVWRTKPQNGYMADFRMADADNDGVKEIVMIVEYAQGGWFSTSSDNTALLIYEMQ